LEQASSFSPPGAPETPIGYPRHAAWLIRQHRSDDAPFAVAEFIARDSRLQFRSLNHVHPVALNPEGYFWNYPHTRPVAEVVQTTRLTPCGLLRAAVIAIG
jgi:hypothetical protein